MNLLNNIIIYFKKSQKDELDNKPTYDDWKCTYDFKEEIVEIKLTDSISISNCMTKEELKKYLKHIMSVEDLGDCLFVKKIGKFSTFKIELTSGSTDANIVYVSKIRDGQNNKINEELFY